MKILITGVNGLVGSEITRLLLSKDHQVYGVSRSKDLHNKDNYFHIQTDLNEIEYEKNLPETMDCVIHLAQSEKFRDFPNSSIDVFNVNTYSTLKLLEYSRKAGVKKFIYASSGGMYGTSDTGFTEESPLQPNKDLGFYLTTKFCSELIAENYSAIFDVNILRLFFVYGPHQRIDMLIPRLVHSVKNEIPVTLQGAEGIKINPIYVSDAAQAIINTFEIKGSSKFNIGGTEILSLKAICDLIGKKTSVIPFYKNDMKVQPKNLIGDISKMERLLLKPKVSFAEGVKSILNLY